MKEIKIEHLAYILKVAKDGNKPQPIFFLGAGASRSGNIPLAGEIVAQILRDYAESPFVKDLPQEERSYAKLMECLQPSQRDGLLKRYIAEAKINVTHIYLAQLLKEGFADYVLTVNFDNLMLRALALYNIFPATYDMAILNDLTTSTFKEGSVVYLHGQSHGLWLLNTHSEMEKVRTTVPRILDSIKNERPWVFIGYSGEDPIFEHIKKLGRFDNGLFWVTYKDHNPNEKVQAFLSEPNTSASVIKGYDADSFMLKLNSALGLGQPSIIDTPFTALRDMLTEIVDIDDQEHFKDVKERLNIAQRQVEEAIRQFEEGETETPQEVSTNKIELLKKEIINLLVSEKWDEDIINDIEQRAVGIDDKKLNSLLAGLYNNLGADLGDLGDTKKDAESEALYQRAFKKYEKAVELNPGFYEGYFNWGADLGNLAEICEGKAVEELYRDAFEKFEKAIEIKPNGFEVYHNWALNLGKLAGKSSDETAIELFQKAFKKFQKASEIEPNGHEIYINWGTYLGGLAKITKGAEAEVLYQEAFEKFQKAIEIKPDKHEAYYNWGTQLGELAKLKDGIEVEELYMQAFNKFQKAIEIKPDKHEAFYNWGTYLGELAEREKNADAEVFYIEAFRKFEKAIEIRPDKYEAYLNWGNSLGDLAKMKEGHEAEALYLQAFEKYQKAIEIKSDKYEVYQNWGVYLGKLAILKEGTISEFFYQQAFEKLSKALSLGADSYNLACWYAIQQNKQNALKYLEISLAKKGIAIPFVETDTDWESLRQDADFIGLLDKYRTAS